MIELVIDQRRKDLGGFEVGRVLPFAKRRMVGPFVFFDHMGPADFPKGIDKKFDVRPHPHIGLSTVTYLFDGEIMHRDSVGSEQAIHPGEVNWMTAGRGITHSERFEKARAQGDRLHGIQAWVALPEANEEDPPSFANYGPADLPTYEADGLWARLIAGKAFGAEAAVKTHSPLFYVHWRLEPGARAQLDPEYPERAAYIAQGTVEVAGQTFHAGQMIVFAPGAPVLFTAVTAATVMLLGGEPLGPRFIEWNFVSSRKERIEQAKADWRAGRMKLPDLDHDEFIPLPGEPPPAAGRRGDVITSKITGEANMDISPPLSVHDVTFDTVADVIVVGMGAAGACAAIEAHEAGADVLVIERTSGGGGSSAMAGGYVYFGGGTRVQKANGFDDTPEEMFKFIMAVTPEPNETKIRLYCDDSVAHFDWMERQGVPFNDRFFPGKDPEHPTDETLSWTGNEDCWPFNEIAKPVPRGHKIGVNGAAAYAMMNALIATVQRIGIRVEFDSAVNALVRDDDGRIVGVRYRQFDGVRYAQARNGVILTTGGYVWNEALIAKYTPAMALEGINPHGAPTSDGAGHLLGESVGGVFMNMQAAMISIPIYAPESRIRGILVNKLGKRFINEDTYHGRATAFAMQQPDMVAYLICDMAAFGEQNGYEALIDAWETVEEMERDLGIPEGALQETLRVYNANAVRGEDPEFHKARKYLVPQVEPPFAAVNITLGPVRAQGLTQGGLTTTENAEVLDAAGKPIPGLYAAGATASNIAKDSAGYASGFMIGESTYFGRRAGRHAAGR